jgi:hypothetical protein
MDTVRTSSRDHRAHITAAGSGDTPLSALENAETELYNAVIKHQDDVMELRRATREKLGQEPQFIAFTFEFVSTNHHILDESVGYGQPHFTATVISLVDFSRA